VFLSLVGLVVHSFSPPVSFVGVIFLPFRAEASVFVRRHVLVSPSSGLSRTTFQSFPSSGPSPGVRKRPPSDICASSSQDFQLRRSYSV